ncbi:hypothetical protein ACFL2R_00875 [Patescibacteria group bacterium]
MGKRIVDLGVLLILLVICIALGFVFPEYTENGDLAGVALITGFFGGTITFFCILSRVMDGNKCKCKNEEEDVQ